MWMLHKNMEIQSFDVQKYLTNHMNETEIGILRLATSGLLYDSLKQGDFT
jgi:hypothetical protein